MTHNKELLDALDDLDKAGAWMSAALDCTEACAEIKADYLKALNAIALIRAHLSEPLPEDKQRAMEALAEFQKDEDWCRGNFSWDFIEENAFYANIDDYIKKDVLETIKATLTAPAVDVEGMMVDIEKMEQDYRDCGCFPCDSACRERRELVIKMSDGFREIIKSQYHLQPKAQGDAFTSIET